MLSINSKLFLYIKHSFMRNRLNKQKIMIVCYQNNIEKKVGHAALAAPSDCSVYEELTLSACTGLVS